MCWWPTGKWKRPIATAVGPIRRTAERVSGAQAVLAGKVTDSEAGTTQYATVLFKVEDRARPPLRIISFDPGIHGVQSLTVPQGEPKPPVTVAIGLFHLPVGCQDALLIGGTILSGQGVC